MIALVTLTITLPSLFTIGIFVAGFVVGFIVCALMTVPRF
jgi:hypothetical protein